MTKNSALLGIGIALVVVGGAFVFLQKPANAPEETPTPTASISSSVTPSASSVPSNSPVAKPGMIVTSPTANAVVNNPITVTGKTYAFEGAFQYALRDGSGKVWFQSTGQAGAPDEVTFYRNFSVKIPVPVGTPKDLIIELFEYSAKDGSIINLVRVPVRLATQQTMTVKVYLNNRRLNGNDACDVVFPVDRTIIKTQETAYLSLIELLKGPTGSDKDAQYYTSIPEGVKLNSLRITNGVAYADFNSTLEYQVGGSCRVGVIRSQITNTLKQFSSVKDVVISIDGRVDDILQP